MPTGLRQQLENPQDSPTVLAFMLHDQWTTIPGTSFKGAIRHLYEAATFSCLLGGKDKQWQRCTPGGGLCPACRIFGALGFTGLVSFRSVLLTTPTRLEFAPVRFSPKDTDEPRRKIYTHWSESYEGQTEPVETLPPNTTFEIIVDFRNLRESELGLLLMVLGLHPDQPIYPKIGGLKAHGFGALQLDLIELNLFSASDYQHFDITPIPVDWKSYCTAAVESSDFYQAGWNVIYGALRERPGGG